MAKAAKVKGKRKQRPIPQVISPRYCAARFPKPRKYPRGIKADRLRLINQIADKWINGTTIRYWFFDKPKKWTADQSQRNVVREAFNKWKALGIGLNFVEVTAKSEADVRIAFEQGDGSWSYVGTDVRTKRADPRTMNFGWSLTEDPIEGMDTALHEIGHTLGFPHEHQNPFAGIVWNEPAVYASLAAPPNEWDKATTYRNIIQKIVPDTVQGSDWDPNSVMHYPFEAGLIERPDEYRDGLRPAGGLSQRDRQWALAFYPAIGAGSEPQLELLRSKVLELKAGAQASFRFKPDQTRQYEFRTFGTSDTVIALYERKGTGVVQIAEDDDSGTDRNAHLAISLKAGAEYVVRIRLNYASATGRTAIMAW